MPLKALLAGLGLIAALLAAPAMAADKNDALDRITKTGTVRIAVPDNFPPFGDLGPDAKPQGYDIDTATLIAEGLSVKLDLVPVRSTDRIPYLTAGKVDLVVSSLGKDPEREKLIDFSSIPYVPFFSGVYGPETLKIASADDLAGQTIAVTRDTIEDTILTKLAPASAAIKRYQDNAATEIAFLFTPNELIATGNAVAAQILPRSPVKKTTFKFLLRNSPCYIGVAKEQPDLRARVDAIIAASRQDGRLDKISEHWLNTPLGDPEHPELLSAK
jgi:polar amino acid transport system substrate-binding protein